MRCLTPSVMFVIFVATPATHAQELENFSNISRAIGKEVSVVERSGAIREGIVEAATAEAVTLRVGSATQTFQRAEIASAERMRDESSDAGYLLDAAESNRQPLYRAPSASSPTLKVSFRF